METGPLVKFENLLFLGKDSLKKCEYQDAINSFEQIITGIRLLPSRFYKELNEVYVSTHYYYGKILMYYSHYNKALKYFDILEECNDLYLQAVLHKGFCYEKMVPVDFSRAEKYFKIVLSRDKDNAAARKALTINLINQHKYEEVMEMYKGDLDAFDKNGYTLLMYAVTIENMPLITRLMETRAVNPFKSKSYDTSAFSIAMDIQCFDIAKYLYEKYTNPVKIKDHITYYILEDHKSQTDEIKKAFGKYLEDIEYDYM